jgi:hypothetical protein
MEYVIAVRTYERPAMFQSHTLTMLRSQGLQDRLYVFVGSDIEAYRTLEPDLRYIQVPKGGAAAIKAICEYFPRRQPILFLDDDLQEFFRYDASANAFSGYGLHDMVSAAFQVADLFSFSSLRNRYWLQKMDNYFRPSCVSIAGCCFGAYNIPELISTPFSHCDDLLRTIQYFKVGKMPWIYQGSGFKTAYAKNPGGLQANGERADTKATCEEMLPLVKDWVSRLEQQECGLYSWKLLPAVTLRRRVQRLSTVAAGESMPISSIVRPRVSSST